MEASYVINPTGFFLTIDDPRIIDKLYSDLSFNDLSIEQEIRRFHAQCRSREKYGNTFPGYSEWKNKREKELLSKRIVFCCQKVSPTQLLVPIGFFQRIQNWTGECGIVLSGIDNRNFDIERIKLVGDCKNLRPYQKAAFEASIKGPVGMIIMATGAGKTCIGEEFIRHHGVPSIFLVPSKPILNQTYERFRYAFGRRNVGLYGGGKKKINFVTVATYQSVYAAKAEEFDSFKLVCFDEVHHIIADTFFEVAENRLLNCVYRLSLTADSERADGGEILVEGAGGPVIYSYDAPQAIREGFLAKPTFFVYEVTKTEGYFIDWKTDKYGKRHNMGNIPTQCFTDPDPHLSQKHWVIGNDILTEFFSALAKGFEKDDKSVLILVDEKEHGEKFKKLIETSEFISSDTKNNQEVIQKFNSRALKILVATSTLGEGADTVPVDVLINLMGGKRPKQANGRALRNDPDENGIPRKPTCIIIDVDFPFNNTLHEQYLHRHEVHKECGQVHKIPMFS